MLALGGEREALGESIKRFSAWKVLLTAGLEIRLKDLRTQMWGGPCSQGMANFPHRIQGVSSRRMESTSIEQEWTTCGTSASF